jgi:hypothetical protein
MLIERQKGDIGLMQANFKKHLINFCDKIKKTRNRALGGLS